VAASEDVAPGFRVAVGEATFIAAANDAVGGGFHARNF
jgi:hypothetical protein